MAIVRKTCVSCRTEFNLDIKDEDILRIELGIEYIQDIVPYLTPGERELFISGICESCFDKMFSEDVD